MKSPPLSIDDMDQITDDVINQLLSKVETDAEQLRIIEFVMHSLFTWIMLHHARIAYLAKKRGENDCKPVEHTFRNLLYSHEIKVSEMIRNLSKKNSPLNEWLETITKNGQNNIHYRKFNDKTNIQKQEKENIHL